MTIQEDVFNAVAARGYVDGWTASEFLARNVVKMQEELGELARLCLWPCSCLASDIQVTAELAEQAFDGWTDAWKDHSIAKHEDAPQIQRELADMQVVLFCMAEIVKKLTGKNFDVVDWALRKSEEDIVRGVRSIYEDSSNKGAGSRKRAF